MIFFNTTNFAATLAIAIPSLILIAGLINDLKSQKVRNYLVVACLLAATASSYFIAGRHGLTMGLMGSLMALGLMLPLVLSKALGAGDLKLMLAFGMATEWNTVMWVIIYSLIWGSILGVLKALFEKEGLALLKNTIKLLKTKKQGNSNELHKIPFTVALLFGWLTHLVLGGTL